MGQLIFFLLAACAFFSGCSKFHRRPGNVPSSAVWIDGTFISCATDKRTNTNHCTVYRDNDGQILEEGVFILNISHAAASEEELRYAAFGNRIIYLEDARMLFQVEASERDPTIRLIVDRLRGIASRGPGEALDCGNSSSTDRTATLSDCAIRAFQNRRPFYFRYSYSAPFLDHSYAPRISYSSFGFAGNADGNVSEVVYDIRGLPTIGLRKGAQLYDDDHIMVVPCARSATLTKSEGGMLACAEVANERESAQLAQQKKPIETSVCAIIENPAAFNNTMVRVSGHANNGMEYSVLYGDGCNDPIWFAYGIDAELPDSAYAKGAMPGSEDAEGKRIPRVPVTLVRDSNFYRFEALLNSRSQKSSGDWFFAQWVTATFVGRIDAVPPEIHAAHQKRATTGRTDYLGFGQLGLFDAQLVMQSVESDAVIGKARKGTTSLKRK